MLQQNSKRTGVATFRTKSGQYKACFMRLKQLAKANLLELSGGAFPIQ